MPSKSQRANSAKSTKSKYRIKFTPHQRESLVLWHRLRPAIQKRLESVPDGTQVIEFTRKELDYMTDELSRAASHSPQPHKGRVVAVRKKFLDLLDALQAEDLGVDAPSRQRPANEEDLLFQFKITLLDVAPAIWRRIQVRDCTLGELHLHIQAAMGWENYHLHQFIIKGERYETPPPDDFAVPFFFGTETIDENTVRLSELLPKKSGKIHWEYEYDFGDDWRHDVRFEGYPAIDARTEYPKCLDGQRACPPEDIGGPWGYVDCLKVCKDPEDERYEDLSEWLEGFDSEAFDANEATKAMRRRPPK